MKHIIFISVLIFSVATINAQEKCDCDYIESGYYQDIYNADFELLKRNEEEAYKYLQSAESKCPLKNIITYYESEKYISLLLKRDEHKKAYHYIHFLISEHGYEIKDFNDLNNFDKLSALPRWDSLYNNLLLSEQNFVSDTALFLQFKKMEYRDQYYRIKLANIRQDTDSFNFHEKTRQFRQEYGENILQMVDDSNFNELMNIIEHRGFPISTNIKLSKYHLGAIYIPLTTMLMHFGTDSLKLQKLETIILENIRKGNLLPDSYGDIIDRKCLIMRMPYIYGIYINTKPEEIYDFEHIDERRKAIGMPPYDISKEKNRILLERYPPPPFPPNK
ncbi:hypothetical protein FACS1894178_4500 [Bacteroidia bacterium]|nr:hypothetical protein FACS1894178_4500 [Bacteroidia bacterium]